MESVRGQLQSMLQNSRDAAYRELNPDLRGGRRQRVEGVRDKRGQEERLQFFGRGAGGVHKVKRKGPLLSSSSSAPCSYPYLTLAVRSLWLPAGDPVALGPGSERREEDSFDSDSTATLLK